MGKMPAPMPEGLVTVDRWPNHAISEDGRIWSIAKHKFLKVRWRTNPHRSKIYLGVVVKDASGKQKQALVHQMVCTAFHGPKPSPRHIARHLDDDVSRNHKDNLAWGLPRDNSADMIRNGKATTGSKNTSCKVGDEDWLELLSKHAAGRNVASLAGEYGLDKSGVYRRIQRGYHA